MRWRALNPAEGRMSADGNGLVLNAVETRGLGMVFTFKSTGKHDETPALIPSQAVDMLMCGRLPVCSVLVGNPPTLLSDKGERLFPKSVLDKFDIKEYGWETHNDLLTLLCDFLPLLECNMVTFYSWEFIGVSKQRSTLTWWEGRWALLRTIEARVKDMPELTPICDSFQKTERLSPHDFYNHVDRVAARARDGKNNADRASKLRGLLDHCRELFDRSTSHFVRRGYADCSNVENQTFYVCLVAANYQLGQRCIKKHGDRESKSKYWWGQAGPPPRAGRVGSDDVYGMACENAANLDHPEWGIVQHLKKHGFETDAKNVAVDWWWLMLRGLVWNLSTELEMKGDRIPPTIYGDPTPVWIA